MREIRRVILHCSATPDYKGDNKAFDLIGAADIDAWHRERGFDEIGYHYVIRRSGVLEKGRAVLKQGAHCKGYNADSIGVCYVGTANPTVKQIDQLITLFWYLKFEYGLDAEDWYCHNEFTDKKPCPGLPAGLLRRMFLFAEQAEIPSVYNNE